MLCRIKRSVDQLRYHSPLALRIERAIGPRVRALPRSAVVLDVGAGRGVVRGAQVAGRYVTLDINPAQRPHVVGDAGQLPFRDSSFDAVCATSVLLVLPSPEAFFAEAAARGHVKVRAGGHEKSAPLSPL